MTVATGAIASRAAVFLTTVVLAVCSCRGALGFVAPTALGGGELAAGKRPGTCNGFMGTVRPSDSISVFNSVTCVSRRHTLVMVSQNDLLSRVDVAARGDWCAR